MAGSSGPAPNKRLAANMNCLADQVISHFRTQFQYHITPLPDCLPRKNLGDVVYTIEGANRKGAKPTIEVRYLWDAVVFKGTPEQMLKFIDLLEAGFIHEDRAVLTVTTPKGLLGPDFDFDDKFTYLRGVEYGLDEKIAYGTQMAEAIQPFSRAGGHPNKQREVIVCIGKQDNLEIRIKQARLFAQVPSILPLMKILFWATKWNDAVWTKYKHFFQLPSFTVILKRVGQDPVDLESGRPLEFRSDRVKDFPNTATHNGYEVP